VNKVRYAAGANSPNINPVVSTTYKQRAEIRTNPGCPPNSSKQPPVESAKICVIGGPAQSPRARHHPSDTKQTHPAIQGAPSLPGSPQNYQTDPPSPRLARSRILDPPLPGPRQKTRNTKQTHPARANPIRLNRSKVSRNTKHETRDTSDSRHKPGEYFSPHAHNNLAPHRRQTTPKKLDPPCYSPAKAGKD